MKYTLKEKYKWSKEQRLGSLWKDKQNQQSFSQANEKKEKSQINKIRDENCDMATHILEIQRLIRVYFEKLHLNKMVNLW
jgi:hypothetical protein